MLLSAVWLSLLGMLYPLEARYKFYSQALHRLRSQECDALLSLKNPRCYNFDLGHFDPSKMLNWPTWRPGGQTWASPGWTTVWGSVVTPTIVDPVSSVTVTISRTVLTIDYTSTASSSEISDQRQTISAADSTDSIMSSPVATSTTDEIWTAQPNTTILSSSNALSKMTTSSSSDTYFSQTSTSPPVSANVSASSATLTPSSSPTQASASSSVPSIDYTILSPTSRFSSRSSLNPASLTTLWSPSVSDTLSVHVLQQFTETMVFYPAGDNTSGAYTTVVTAPLPDNQPPSWSTLTTWKSESLPSPSFSYPTSSPTSNSIPTPTPIPVITATNSTLHPTSLSTHTTALTPLTAASITRPTPLLTTSSSSPSTSTIPTAAQTHSRAHLTSFTTTIILVTVILVIILPILYIALFFLYRHYCPNHYVKTEKYCPLRICYRFLTKSSTTLAEIERRRQLNKEKRKHRKRYMSHSHSYSGQGHNRLMSRNSSTSFRDCDSWTREKMLEETYKAKYQGQRHGKDVENEHGSEILTGDRRMNGRGGSRNERADEEKIGSLSTRDSARLSYGSIDNGHYRVW